MAGPGWLAGVLAAIMILIAAYSAGRLVVSRRNAAATEADADGLHMVMGTAMAGMLVPQLNLLPATTWMAVFGAGAAWFGGCALLSRSGRSRPGLSRSGLSRSGRSRPGRGANWQCRFPVPHLIECIAMLYMLLAVRGAGQGAAMAMPGMGTSAGASPGFPALAVVLALFMIGYLMWTTDQLAAMARARQPAAADPAAGLASPAAAGLASPAAAAGTLTQEHAAGQAVLAPKQAACVKIVMCITMGYMLLLML